MFTHVLELGTLLCVRGINVRLRECDKYMKIAGREREKKHIQLKLKPEIAQKCQKLQKITKIGQFEFQNLQILSLFLFF